MNLRRLRALTLALLASLTLCPAVLAGGWATVSLYSPPPDPGAGDPVAISLTVLQHGVTPIHWIALTVVATNATTGEAVMADALPAGPLGHYVATLTFPHAGEWSISYQSADLIMEGSASLSVTAAVAVGTAAEASSAAGVGSSAPTVLIGLLLALLVGGLTALVARERRASRDHRPAPAGG